MGGGNPPFILLGLQNTRSYIQIKKVMKDKSRQQILAEILQRELDVTEKMWNQKERSEAFIVGYLQGLVKQAISELQD
jgi:hypothetical protein